MKKNNSMIASGLLAALMALSAVTAFASDRDNTTQPNDTATTTAEASTDTTDEGLQPNGESGLKYVIQNNTDYEIRTSMYLGCASGPDYGDAVIKPKAQNAFSWSSYSYGTCSVTNKMVIMNFNGGVMAGSSISSVASWSFIGSAGPFSKPSLTLKSDLVNFEIKQQKAGFVEIVISNK